MLTPAYVQFCQKVLGLMFSDYVINWQAWATFAAGLLAVSAAVMIGRRQLAITARQAQISERQAEIQAGQPQLQQLSLKIAIFDKRMKVFDTMIRYVAKIQTQTGVTEEETRDFLLTVNESRFLFTKGVFEKAREWARKCAALRDAQTKAPLDEEGKRQNTPKIEELLGWMDVRSTGFVDIFANEIDVSDISSEYPLRDPANQTGNMP